MAPAPMSSNTSTGSSKPFTGTVPNDVTSTKPSASRKLSPVIRTVPGVASCSMRFARCTVGPMAS